MTETTEVEQVVMTPKAKTANSTTLIIERRKVNKTSDKMHVAGGEHTGIIINKEASIENGESRTLRFWFRPPKDATQDETDGGQAGTAQDFFRELVSPQEFPRDYVGFIKKIMKLMQHNYQTIAKLEVELKQLEEPVEVPSRPPPPGYRHIQLGHFMLSHAGLVSAEENSLGNIVVLTIEKVLEIIESSYPNPITIKEMAKDNGWDEEEVAQCLAALQSRNLVKDMDHGAFTRQQSQQDSHQVTIVKQMPTMVSSKQPTIAIITAQYCEKLAVDAMIENKETFVRYTTVVC
ncbi:hypothetical protein NQ317_008378 [Molorchus minor]|uniref:Winged helix-turn-helix domain-containing protein n=1 Tax=Molorchus minor TaxID=1323400 RepID=A0ABQ9K5P6_9CUCU|nr:hypothetical protein NQ317_008378 [Molorchus minor]